MKLKLSWLLIATFMFNLSVFAQEEKKEEKKGYQFTDKIIVPHTSVKNQYRSGTCWSFSGVGFVEAELMRLQGKEYDLSEMFIVNHTYRDRATKYVRLGGKLNFGAGAEFTDVFRVIREYGMVPDTVYPGLNYGEKKHVHGEMDAVLQSYVDAVVKNKNRKLTPVWHDGFDKVVDTYLGELPTTFTYEGKEYTPESFRDMTGINPDDYVAFTSYTHHPFYKPFALAISDNWLWADWMNIPMEDMMAIIDNALENGYTVAWGADVSDKGFSWKKGVAVIPDEERPDLSGTDRANWEKLTAKEKRAALYGFDKPIKEKVITQEMRQKEYNDYEVTDDHGMQIVGIAYDQNGDKFYKIKNSWGTDQVYKGYFYASVSFVELQTIGITVHKKAIPKKIAKECGIK
ncbi:MAG: aminopeptidase [Bacteroidetes bacterium]|nr:MAG: aminopeptidase [Bacteroidota bacterium]